MVAHAAGRMRQRGQSVCRVRVADAHKHLCIPKIRSERNDDAVHPISARTQSSHGAGFLVKEASPSPVIDACGAHCNILYSFAGAGEDVFH